MSDDVAREALHDWLDERPYLATDEQPDPADYDDRPASPPVPPWPEPDQTSRAR